VCDQHHGRRRAQGDVGGVGLARALLRGVEEEVDQPLVTQHRRAQRRWVRRDERGETCQIPVTVDQRQAGRDLSGVADVQEPERMPRLLVERELAAASTFALLGHPSQVPQDPVHRDPVHHQPGPAVDPRPPLTGRGDGQFSTVPADGEIVQSDEVESVVVVDAEVDIRVGSMGAARTTAAECDRANAGDADKVAGHLPQPPVAEHDLRLGKDLEPIQVHVLA
jgi:hypothetical protein